MSPENRCYECQIYGNDSYIDADGNFVWVCDDCPFNDDMEVDGDAD